MSIVNKLIQKALKESSLLKENKNFNEGDRIKAKEDLYYPWIDKIRSHPFSHLTAKDRDSLVEKEIEKGDILEYKDGEWVNSKDFYDLSDKLIDKYFTKIN